MTKKLLLTLVLSIFIAGHCFSANQNTFNKRDLSIGNDTTVSFAVNGTAACKSNIEAALTANSVVTSASWDASSKIVTVTYLTASLKKTDLFSLLAHAGYDNAELRAKKSVYDALPSACQYTRDPETE